MVWQQNSHFSVLFLFLCMLHSQSHSEMDELIGLANLFASETSTEMSEETIEMKETILSISSIPLVVEDCDFYINLGNVGRTIWSLRPKWTKIHELVYFEILRTTRAGRVELQINLIWQSGEDEEKTFVACFEEGQKTVRVRSGWPKSFQESDKLKGAVTICLKSAFKTPKEESTVSHLDDLSDDLLLLFNNPDSFPDATLKCNTAKILVHKSILSARSPVFAAMFKSQMQESQGIVDIVDIEESVLIAVLKFIYSGKAEPLTEVLAGDVLFAADKYQLKELKLICIKKLKSSMTVNNVFRILVLGHLHDESLKSYAKEFICKYHKFSEFEKTEEWSMLEQEHPMLTIELLKSVVIYTLEICEMYI